MSMRLGFQMFVASAAVAVVALFAGGAEAAPPAGGARVGVGPAVPVARVAVQVVRCDRPPALRLIRFEDGSARLQCGRRLLVRVAVPG